MGLIAITLFVGVSYLAVHMNAHPSQSVSVISEIARGVFPASSALSPLYYAVQALTFAILVLAANTSYQGFPRLAAVLARDRFFPRQFVNLGDRLVYSNGILVLAAIASLLIWVFHANVISLIHLYVIGVFTAFTISQAGMVRYWARRQGARLAPKSGDQRRRRVRHRGRDAPRDPGEVHRRRLDGRDRRADADRALPRRATGITGSSTAGCARALQRSRRPRMRRTRSSSTSTASIRPRNSARGTRTRSRAPPTTRSGSRTGTAGRIRAGAGGSSPEEGRGSSRSRRSEDTADAVLDYVWSLPRGESNFLTVVLPELFEHRSLVSAVARQADDVLPEAPPPVGAGDRRGERPARLARRRAAADTRGRARARVGGPRLVGPRGQLRPDARAPGHESRLLRLRRRTRRGESSESGTARRSAFRSRSSRRPSATSAIRCAATCEG